MLAIPVALLSGGVALLVAGPRTPQPVQQLRRAEEASGKAQQRSERIARALEELASNLELGAGLEAQSDEINELTARQRRSLQDLVEVLENQLTTLERSGRVLEGTEETTEGIARLSGRQADAIRRAVAALGRIEDAAADAGRFSALVAARARYAARLAEDSQKAFETP